MTDTEKLIASIVHEATPIKSATHPFVLSAKWLAGMVAYVGLYLMVVGVRPDLLLKFQAPLFVGETGLLAGIVVATCLSAALLSFPDVHQKRLLAFAPVVMSMLFVWVLCMAWYADNPATHPPVHNMKCTISIALLALLPAVWMFYTMRGFASTHPYSAGSVALLAAFGIGALSLRLAEPTDSIMHVMLWHYLPMLSVAILGLWLGKKFLKW